VEDHLVNPRNHSLHRTLGKLFHPNLTCAVQCAACPSELPSREMVDAGPFHF